MGELNHNDLQATLDQIYTFSHLASACKNQHNEWREDFLKTEKFLIDNGIISDCPTSTPAQTPKDQS
jgi:hypothetical protein